MGIDAQPRQRAHGFGTRLRFQAEGIVNLAFAKQFVRKIDLTRLVPFAQLLQRSELGLEPFARTLPRGKAEAGFGHVGLGGFLDRETDGHRIGKRRACLRLGQNGKRLAVTTAQRHRKQDTRPALGAAAFRKHPDPERGIGDPIRPRPRCRGIGPLRVGIGGRDLVAVLNDKLPQRRDAFLGQRRHGDRRR